MPVLALLACAASDTRSGPAPTWTEDDLKFLLHGSMSSEFIPERVFNAFLMAYPDLFPGGNLAAYGAIADPAEGLPVGFSRREVPHLGRQKSIGINCAVCHVAEVQLASDPAPVRVLGKPSLFNVYAFFGAIAVAMLKTADPAAMDAFLHKYLRAGDPSGEQQKLLSNAILQQKDKIAAAIAADPLGSKGLTAGELYDIRPEDLELNGKRLHAGMDLVPLVQALLKLFHNIRTALHIPDELGAPLPTLPGPGRTDAFGVLAAAFFAFPSKFEAPVKFGVTWNLANRPWVHWDGNNNEPLARNLGASLGLGTPMIGKGKLVSFADIKRHTDLTESIRAPRYPWAIDRAAAERGLKSYQARCASCHEAPQDRRLYSVEELGTDKNRALFFDEKQAELLNRWVSELQVAGYQAPAVTFRSTKKYWASDMAGAWARSPYLHNGSVRTMEELLMAPSARARTFKVGSRVYDPQALGLADDGAFVFDTSLPGNSNAGHAYGTDLSGADRRDLIEYLKTR